MKRILFFMVSLVLVSSCGLLGGGKGGIQIINSTTEYDFLNVSINSGSVTSTVLTTNQSITVGDLDSGDVSVSIQLSNFNFGLDTGGKGMVYNNVHNFNIVTGQTNDYTIFPAYLTISNKSALNLGYVYINSTNSYDLMHIMGVTSPGVTNFLIPNDGYIYTNEFIAGTYQFIFVSGKTNNVRNTNIISVSLSAFETNHIEITSY